MYRCEDCQRDFKTPQALSGHNQFRHGGKPAAGRAAEQVNQQLTKPALQQLVAAQASNAQQQEDMLVNGFQQLDEKFSKLSEVVDGLLIMPDEYADHGHGQHHHDPTTCEDCRDMVDQILEANPDDQLVEHEHGDGCELCVHQQLVGVRRTTSYVNQNVPGAKEALEHAITGQKVLTVVADPPKVANTKDLSDTEFKLFAAGVMKEAGERGIL